MSLIDPHEESLFAAALELRADARDAYLREQCADPELRRRVEQLLALHDTRAGVLDNFSVTELTSKEELGPGDSVGPYELIEEIGSGGMGVVFRAEQQQPVRRMVALKLIKPGMDTRSVIARFEAERQALALLDHPSITKVLDGGATSRGRPYFVMELCQGKSISRYCCEQELDLTARLRLFVQLCESVEHAHQKGILHRDLKPSNILITEVDGLPCPKIIDFGIAKALTTQLAGETSVTYQGQLLGTPEYMSPEQCRDALDVDTRTDVYSLGVILFELLTDTTPTRHLGNDLDAIREFLKREDTALPSQSLQKQLTVGATPSAQQGDATRLDEGTRHTLRERLRITRGELDWIVRRALARQRDERYQSAADLGREVQRYLSGDAVEAAAPTWNYRLRKIYQRHRTATWVGASFALVISVAAVVSTLLAFQLRDSLLQVGLERDRALEAEGRLSKLERQQRNRASHFRAVARYVSQSMNEGLRNVFAQAGGGKPILVGSDATLDAMINDIEGNGAARQPYFGNRSFDISMLGFDDLELSFDLDFFSQVQPLIDFDLPNLDLPNFDEIPPALVPFLLEARREEFGDDDPFVVETLLEMGNTKLMRKDWKGARGLLGEALGVMIEIGNSQPLGVVIRRELHEDVRAFEESSLDEIEQLEECLQALESMLRPILEEEKRVSPTPESSSQP